MLSEIAIKVEDLSKRYFIYNQPHDRLKQFIYPRLQRIFGKQPKHYFSEFWALNQMSFEIRKGETVGIIGRNGSGKSTLLQLICGTLHPSSGTIQTNGRIAALLELGAGFNLEFTGRENIYMNATILGLSKAEIDAKYGDIISFADIGAFVDQPVKTYSSGMFVRLAFSVAVHTDPQILIVDEALSVGDIAFQNKCMQKIKELKKQGTSILFVSHDLSAMQIICDRVFLIKKGKLIMTGLPVEVCQEYYVDTMDHDSETPTQNDVLIPQQSTSMAFFSKICLQTRLGYEKKVFEVEEDICFELELNAEKNLEEVVLAFSLYRADGEWILGQTSREKNVFWPPMSAGMNLKGKLLLSPNCLGPGDYKVAFGAYSKDHQLCYALTDLAISFAVRSNYQTWGKFIHPCDWSNTTADLLI